MEFVWDTRKAKANLIKHGVSFADAKSVFFDDYARLKHDLDHSTDEERYLLLGMSSLLKVLVVIHTVIENDAIRLISARKATRKEAKQYRRFKS